MDLTAILLTAAALAGKAALSAAAKDAYQKLKNLVIRKSGSDSDIELALAGLEKKPDSKARQAVLKEEVQTAGIGDDLQIVRLARQLQEILQQEGHSVQVSYQASLSGSGAIAQGPGAVAAGQGGIAVGGDVHGGIQSGDKKGGG